MMAFEYKINPERKVALLTFSGSITGAELAEATKALYHDEAWQYGFNAIWDFSQITELLLEFSDFQGLAALDREYVEIAGPGLDVFIVVRQWDHAMRQTHMVLAKQAPRQSHVRHSLSEAWALLGQESLA